MDMGYPSMALSMKVVCTCFYINTIYDIYGFKEERLGTCQSDPLGINYRKRKLELLKDKKNTTILLSITDPY